MTGTLDRLSTKRGVTWRTVFGLMLVPLTVAGVLLWGLWQPNERLDTMTAAVVNLDKPVTLNGQTVPMGRVLAAELIGGGKTAGEKNDSDTTERQNFDWQLTDKSDAAAGLKDGRYTAVITIPADFSKDATSAADGADSARQATIDVQTGDQGRLLDGALANIVTSTATSVLNQKLGEQSVAQVFVGMQQLGEGVGDAADGAHKLADGGKKLAKGVDGVADGTSELADGTTKLADGSSALADGTAQLVSGAGALAGGANQLAEGSNKLADGAKRSAGGGKTLAEGVKTYTEGATKTIDGLQQLNGASIEPVKGYRAAIEADLIPMPNPEVKAQVLGQLDQLIGGLSQTSNPSKKNPVNQVKAAGKPIADGAKASADGQRALAQGAKQTAQGTQKLAAGVGQLAAGLPGLAEGAQQLADGTEQLAGGTRELATGTKKLADGAGASANGAEKLADGLTTAADKIPNNTKAQSEHLASTMVTPVKTVGSTEQLFNSAGVPLFAGIALWAGALATFLVLSPLWRRTTVAARGLGYVTLRSAAPAALIGAIQGLLAGVILPPLLGYNASQWFGFLGLAITAGVVFALLNQGLSALLGGFGRFLSFALLVVAFAIGVVSTAPAVLQAIGDGSPIGALFSGFQAVAGETGGAGGAIGALILWGLGGLLLTGFAAARARKASPLGAPQLV